MRDKNKRKTGAEYEGMAAVYLAGEGYQIIERNHKNKGGEIDILAKKDDVLVICEVKFRSAGSYGDPLETVDRYKQRRICRAALYYYMECGYGLERPCRFDVIAIYGDGSLKHIENAYEYQE